MQPQQIGTDADWLNVSAADHTCAVKTGGTAWCQGRNNAGQLGVAISTPLVRQPTRVGTDSDWRDVWAAGRGASGHTCAARLDGTIACWGDNRAGQLGNGTSWGPVQVALP